MPIYEYDCPDHGRFEVLYKKIPDEVPTEATCPTVTRETPTLHVCAKWSVLMLSLGFYGEAEVRSVGRLTRAQRRYHERAPEREVKEREERPGLRRSKDNPITREDVERYGERVRRSDRTI